MKIKFYTVCCSNGDGSVGIKFFSDKEDAEACALHEENTGEPFTEQPGYYELDIDENTGLIRDYK